MLKNFWKSFVRAVELSSYERVLRECYGVLDQEQTKRIRERISELSSK
jgi:hypothetical protein